MDSVLKAAAYLAIGMVVAFILWRKFDIHWETEQSDTKALIIACVPAWPLVLLLVIAVWVRGQKWR